MVVTHALQRNGLLKNGAPPVSCWGGQIPFPADSSSWLAFLSFQVSIYTDFAMVLLRCNYCYFTIEKNITVCVVCGADESYFHALRSRRMLMATINKEIYLIN
jgi:hypothetical protein